MVTKTQRHRRNNPVLRRGRPAGATDESPDVAPSPAAPADLMNPGGKSHLEASRRTPVLSTRTTTKIGTWNVQTMFETGKLYAVEKEMERYGLDILGVSEARWNGEGKKKLGGGKLLLYSGREEGEIHQSGVALLLSKQARDSLIDWEGHGDRILRATFRSSRKRLHFDVIMVYAPTNEADEETKELFYARLAAVVDRRPRRNMLMVMGDLNAKVGDKNEGYEAVMGNEGLGDMNDNGERFADFCDLNDLVIGGSVFQHKKIHKVTWRHPNGTHENQIDHIAYSRKFRRCIADVRVMKGATVGSDHNLVVGKVKLKLKKNWKEKTKSRQKFNTAVLKNPAKQEEFKLALSNRFQVLENLPDDSTVEEKWQTFKDATITTCQEVLGTRKYQHKDWISADTIQNLEERQKKHEAVLCSRTREGKRRAATELTEANAAVKTSARADKRKYLEGLAQEAEEAAAFGDSQTLYGTIRKLSGNFSKPEVPVKDKEGESIPGERRQMERWREHFEDLLNRPPPANPPDIEPATEDLDIDCDVPDMDEIMVAIKQQKSGKAAGPDDIPPEAMKEAKELTSEALHLLFEDIWEEEEIPLDWKEGYIIKIPKKGDLSVCSNYRGISLLSVPSKIFNRVILNRIKNAADPKLRDNQAGFRKNRSCKDQIATLRVIVEQSLEWNTSLYINFIDYEKAFDSVDRNTLWKLLRHYGVPEKIVSLIRKSYDGMNNRVVHGQQLTDSFKVHTGVRQGCLLSPFLFLLAIDWVMKESTAGKRNGIQWTLMGPHSQLDDLDFADDLALLSSTKRQMQTKTDIISENSGKLGLRINRGKTKVMRINNENLEPITVYGEPIEEVLEFIYLGSIVDMKGGTDADIKARKGKARTAFKRMKNVWSSAMLSTRTKIRIFNSTVKPVLLYGCETWRMNETPIKKLQTFINACLRKILRIYWPETISNSALWEQAGQTPVKEDITLRKWKWVGHTLRRPESITRQALTWNPQGKRRQGRPRNTWRRDLEKETQKMGLTWGELCKLAEDRDAFRRRICGLCSSGD